MSPEPDPTEGEPELTEIEEALAALAPSRSRLDRDRVMYQAGRSSNRSGPSGTKTWMAVAAGLGMVALGEGALLARQPSERVVERIVVIHEPAAAVPTIAVEPLRSLDLARSPVAPGPSARDRLAWQVLRYGLDALPAPGPSMGGVAAASQRSLREQIDKVLELGDSS